jgi:nucleotide-binding universal stress UspA family protein
MYRSIVVPLDGSPFAEQVLPAAVALATRWDAVLVLLRVHRRLPTRGASEYDALTRRVDDALLLDEARAYLETLPLRLDDAARCRIRTSVVESDGVAETIARVAEQARPALVAMTTHGRTGFARVVLGSVADGVVRRSGAPVLLWRARERWRGEADHGPVTHALVALDGSLFAEEILPHAVALAQAAGARCTLAQVVSPVRAAVPTIGEIPLHAPWSPGAREPDWTSTQDELRGAEGYLERTAAEMRDGCLLQVDHRVEVDERPGDALLRIAHATGADLVAMTTHGRGASRLVIGSVADAFIRESSCNLLLMRPLVS